jgi:hypothetical protein
MFVRSNQTNSRDDLIPLAESLADAFADAGDRSAAGRVLHLVSKHSISDGIALRQAEQAFANGDATAALDALVPAWEAGSADLHLETQMGLASLALGLYDVVETLTDREEFSLNHSVLRWLAGLADGFETPSLDWAHRPAIWSATAMLKTLAHCGRTDIVHLAQAYADANDAMTLGRSIEKIPSSEPIACQPASPPTQGRADFKESWTLPGGDVVFNWAWSSARQAFTGERVLVIGPDASLLVPFTDHAVADYISEPYGEFEELGHERQTKPGRYEHIISIYDLNRTLDPRAVFSEYTRCLTHEGQLHLLVAGSGAASAFDMGLSRGAVERLCEAVGLKLIGCDSRDETGMPTASESASVHLIRAEKRII